MSDRLIGKIENFEKKIQRNVVYKQSLRYLDKKDDDEFERFLNVIGIYSLTISPEEESYFESFKDIYLVDEVGRAILRVMMEKKQKILRCKVEPDQRLDAIISWIERIEDNSKALFFVQNFLKKDHSIRRKKAFLITFKELIRKKLSGEKIPSITIEAEDRLKIEVTDPNEINRNGRFKLEDLKKHQERKSSEDLEYKKFKDLINRWSSLMKSKNYKLLKLKIREKDSGKFAFEVKLNRLKKNMDESLATYSKKVEEYELSEKPGLLLCTLIYACTRYENTERIKPVHSCRKEHLVELLKKVFPGESEEHYTNKLSSMKNEILQKFYETSILSGVSDITELSSEKTEIFLKIKISRKMRKKARSYFRRHLKRIEHENLSLL